jgi:hypothetical protein
MATLRPFRQYDEHDVINMFAYKVDEAADGNGVVVQAGRLVKALSGGWVASDDIHDLTSSAPNAGGDLGLAGKALSLRYNLVAQVHDAVGSANEPIIGMLLHDVKTLDENGEQLKFNPRKADEMQVVIPGQAVPLVTKGIFLIHGLAGLSAGDAIYCDANGDFDDTDSTGSSIVVGHALGNYDDPASPGYGSGTTLIKLELP